MEQHNAQQLEHHIEQCLWTCIELYEQERYADMSQHFAALLAAVQRAGYINYSFDVLVPIEQCLPHAQLLLQSLQQAKARKTRKQKLLTHRQILRVWLRQHKAFSHHYLPATF